MKIRILVAVLAATLPPSSLAQTQQGKPPIAVYWMSVETAGGMGMEMPLGMGGLMPPGMQGGKRLKLELGSSQQASGDPRAASRERADRHLVAIAPMAPGPIRTTRARCRPRARCAATT